MNLDDPCYRRMLGLAADAPLANWYDLLGVAATADTRSLEQAVVQRMMLARKYQVGVYEQQALLLLNELSRAFVTLTAPAERAAYDRSIQGASPVAANVEDLAAAVLAGPVRTRRARARLDSVADESVWPMPGTPTRPPADHGLNKIDKPDKAACPKCGKPMPAASAVCYQCGFKRISGAAAPRAASKDAEQGALRAKPAAFAGTDWSRQDLSADQLLANLQCERDVNAAFLLAERHCGAKGGACCFCLRRMTRSDAYALESSTFCQLEEYLAHLAKQQQLRGKTHFTWPLSPADLQGLSQLAAADRSQIVRLFCGGCVRRVLKSRRIDC